MKTGEPVNRDRRRAMLACGARPEAQGGEKRK